MTGIHQTVEFSTADNYRNTFQIRRDYSSVFKYHQWSCPCWDMLSLLGYALISTMLREEFPLSCRVWQQLLDSFSLI